MEILTNVILTSLLVVILSYIINSPFVPEDKESMSDKHVALIGTTLIAPIVILTASIFVKLLLLVCM